MAAPGAIDKVRCGVNLLGAFGALAGPNLTQGPVVRSGNPTGHRSQGQSGQKLTKKLAIC